MSELVRFGVSLGKELLKKFDKNVKEKDYPTRSKAIEDLIRESLLKSEWVKGSKGIAGAVTLVYDHHKRELVTKLMDIEHDYHHLIISSQHVHLDHNNCLEIVAVKGKPKDVQGLANKLKATKGVKHGYLTVASE